MRTVIILWCISIMPQPPRSRVWLSTLLEFCCPSNLWYRDFCKRGLLLPWEKYKNREGGGAVP